jgi:hypothetical protein
VYNPEKQTGQPRLVISTALLLQPWREAGLRRLPWPRRVALRLTVYTSIVLQLGPTEKGYRKPPAVAGNVAAWRWQSCAGPLFNNPISARVPTALSALAEKRKFVLDRSSSWYYN